MPIEYVIGDATEPVGDGLKVLAHVVNDEGKWGAGFVLALSKKWSEPEAKYRLWHQEYFRGTHYGQSFRLGNIQQVVVDDDRTIVVANMLAQRGVRHDSRLPRALDYGALANCLNQLKQFAADNNRSVHMPRIGAGLGGGDWSIIAELIEALVVEKGVPVTVYDLR